MLRGEFIGVNAYVKKEERSQINNITCLETLLEEQTKPKGSRRKEIIKIREEINEMKLIKE